MSDSILKMVLAGILFGAWPLLMNRSGLTSSTANVVFSAIVLLIVLPFAMSDGVTFSGTKWWFAVLAGVAGGLGLLVFSSEIAKASQENMGKLFVVMLVVQASVPAVYHAYMNGGLSIKTASGFAAAIVATVLLV